jgi:hypothetical protein
METTMTYPYSFEDCLHRAERITWRVEDLMSEDKVLDFTKPFMPEDLARTAALDFLSPADRLALNQIRGHAYLAIFGLVEEFILPFVLDHARPEVSGESFQSRAFLEFAAEEAKHIQMFRVFREAFQRGFGVRCDVIGPPADVARHVLSHPALSVALLILHIEWMTQRHFSQSVEDNQDLEPAFKAMLLHHWMEERQHAQLDTLVVEQLAQHMSEEDIQAGLDGYLALGAFLDGHLKQQAQFDLEELERATGRKLKAPERVAFMAAQHQANRWTYIGSGMSHPLFLETVGKLSAPMAETLTAAAPTFS